MIYDSVTYINFIKLFSKKPHQTCSLISSPYSGSSPSNGLALSKFKSDLLPLLQVQILLDYGPIALRVLPHLLILVILALSLRLNDFFFFNQQHLDGDSS